MATVLGGGGEKMLLLRQRRRRLPLADLTNLSSATSVITRLKPAARSKPQRQRQQHHQHSRGPRGVPPQDAAAGHGELRDQILSGRASFADLAAQHSDCSSARRGGDLGVSWVYLKSNNIKLLSLGT